MLLLLQSSRVDAQQSFILYLSTIVHWISLPANTKQTENTRAFNENTEIVRKETGTPIGTEWLETTLKSLSDRIKYVH